jgi:hypothetical protein
MLLHRIRKEVSIIADSLEFKEEQLSSLRLALTSHVPASNPIQVYQPTAIATNNGMYKKNHELN